MVNVKNAPDQDSSPDAIDRRFRSVTVLQFNEIQLLKAGKYNALAFAMQRRLTKAVIVAAAIVVCFAFLSGFSPVVLAMEAAIMAGTLLWTGPRLYRLHQTRFLIPNHEDPKSPNPADNIDADFRGLTTLMFNEIQLLKTRKYRSLVAAIRTRLSAMISFAVLIAIRPILAYQTSPERAFFGVGIVAVSLIWVLPRFHRLNRLEFLTRELADDEVGEASNERDTVSAQEPKSLDAFIGKVDGDRDCGFEELQTEIRRTGTLSYSDIQRLKAGEFVLVPA